MHSSDPGTELTPRGRFPRERLVAAALGVLVAASVILALWWARAPEATLVKVGQQAPELEIPSMGATGKTRLSSLRGRPVLLVMFLSGCHTCEAEIPQIERLHREFFKKGLLVLGVSVDPDHATRQDFLRRHDVTFIVLEDDNGKAVRAAFGSWKMPEAYLIDAQGRVDAVFLGSVNWKSEEVRERIQKLLPQNG